MSGNVASYKSLQYILLLWISLFSLSAAIAQSTDSVTATVQPAKVTVGDSLDYRITVNLTSAAQPSVDLPQLNPSTGLSAPSPNGTQSSAETYIVNGSYRSVQKVTYGYSIKTSKVGTYLIPPATVTMGGKSYKTKPVTVVVQSAPKAANVPDKLKGLVAAPSVPSNPELQRKLTGAVFVLPVLPKTDPYNGEQIRIAYHLAVDKEALQAANLLPRMNLDGVHVPPMNEFLTEELYPFPQDVKFQERDIGGKRYLVAPVYEAVIASTKSGKLNIEPFQISMILSSNNPNRRAASPFGNDPLFSALSGSMGMGMMGGSSVQVVAQSPELTLDVKPIPEAGRPADFAGAVGEFKILAEVDKKKARAYDDTIALNVTVQGEGNTESMSPPTLPSLPGFTVLGDPEVTIAGHKDNDTYVSVKKFAYTLRPTTPGAQKIPAIQMSYFEPEKKQFLKVQSDPISLEIAAGTHPSRLPVPTAEPEKESPKGPAREPDLRYISTEILTAPNSGFPQFRGMTGLGLFLIPPVLLLGAGLVSWSRTRAQNKKVDARRLLKQQSDRHLKEAESAVQSKDYKMAQAELGEGIRMFFAAQFDLPAGETTIPVIEDELRQRGAPADLIDGIERVLEICDSTQYAPVSIANSDAKQVYTEAVRLLGEAEAYT